MNIAVLSGKGGAGKTLVSVNLAYILNNSKYYDCDVEEPNGHLYFKSPVSTTKNINVKIPKVDNTFCCGCRNCVEFCKFNALAFIKGKVKVFDSICHSCGGCALFCPNATIGEVSKVIGVIEKRTYGDVEAISGIMNIGEASGVPIIKEMLSEVKNSDNTVIDCPPGSACVVMESIKNSDYCVITAEPTVFGLHNMKMVIELAELFGKPLGVVINKYTEEINPVSEYCRSMGYKILGSIPYDTDIAKLSSDGVIISEARDDYKDMFNNILESIRVEVEHEAVTDTKR